MNDLQRYIQGVPSEELEKHLLLRMMEVGVSMASGQGVIEKVTTLLSDYRAANLPVQGCEALGFALLPSLRRGNDSAALREAAEILVAESLATHYSFWEPLVRSRFPRESAGV